MPLKIPHIRKCCVIRRQQNHSASAIHSEMSPIYFDKRFTRPVIYFSVRNLLMSQKVLLMRDDLLTLLFQRLLQRP